MEILTAMPNYPEMRVHKDYRGRFFVREEVEGILIRRSWIYAGSSKAILPRLLNYFSFVFSSLLIGVFRTGRYDYIFCESPPLFLGLTSRALCALKGARLIFNVSDLWPESAEKLGLVTNRSLLRMAGWLEAWLYRGSALITGQTRGIVESISSRFPGKEVFWLRNGVNASELESVPADPALRQSLGIGEKDFVLLYAGILGHAQGLEVILRAAALLREEKEIRFLIMGSGPEKEKLLHLKADLGLANVTFLESRPRNEVIPFIHASDAAVVPLRKLSLFLGAIPSKIFENLALRKPILLGVEGEAKELLIDEGKTGLSFVPENPEDLASKVLYLYRHPEKRIEFGNNGHDYLLREFNPSLIIDAFWRKINA